MQKRIVVLGGAGFIGTHLCLRLLAQGHQVFCVDLREPAVSPLLRDAVRHPAFRYVRHNIINTFGIRCDEIYNLTAPSMVRYDKHLPVETLKATMLGAINTLDTARTEHARVLFASSGDIYDTGFHDNSVTSAAYPPDKRLLAEGKRAAETLHRAYQAEYGVDTRIARIFNSYGPGTDLMDQRVVMKMIVAALQNRDIPIYGSGEQLRTFCWVEDIVEGLLRLMAAPAAERTRIVDLGAGHEISVRALAEKIVEASGSSSQIVHTEARTGEARRRQPDLSTARRELEWAPSVALADGLRRTIDYARRELAGQSHPAMTWAEMN